MTADTHHPSASRTVLPFYLTASLMFVAVCALCLWNRSAFMGHYFQPHILAITHLGVLGWLCMIVFGASHQLVPVLSERPLYSETLAIVSYALLLAGSLLLGYGFYTFAVGPVLEVAALTVLSAFAVFCTNILTTLNKSHQSSFQLECLRTACYWLLFTALLGTVLVFNLSYAFLPQGQLFYLGLHAHAGMLGWFLLLIMAVASKLLPMFLLSTYKKEQWLKRAYYLVNAGLLMLVTETFLFKNLAWEWLAALLVLLGMASFGIQIRQVFRFALRRKKDAALRMTALALALMGVPVLLLAMLLLDPGTIAGWNVTLLLSYGWSFLAAFLSSLVMAQTFKTLPFIVWMHRYQSQTGPQPKPQPKDLYNENHLQVLFYSYLLAIGTWLGGMLMHRPGWLELGGFLLTLSSAYYAWNVIEVMTGRRIKKIPHGTTHRPAGSPCLPQRGGNGSASRGNRS